MYHNQLLSMIPTDVRGGVLLEGPRGLYQYDDALCLAARVLNAESDIENHPDLIIMRKEGVFTVEDIGGLSNSLALMPARAKRRCVIMEGADKLLPAAQNKLLKNLEEADAFFILISYADLLGTIKSRLMLVRYSPLSESAFLQAGGTKLDYYVTGGCPQLLDREVLRIFEASGKAVLEGQIEMLLKELGLVKEKGKRSFYELYRNYVPMLFCYLGRCLTDAAKEFRRIEIAADAAVRSTRTMVYTSADFFVDIVSLI